LAARWPHGVSLAVETTAPRFGGFRRQLCPGGMPLFSLE